MISIDRVKEVLKDIEYKDPYVVPKNWDIMKPNVSKHMSLVAAVKLKEEFGFDSELFRIAVGWLPTKVYHSVLVIETNEGFFVYDEDITKIEEKEFKFHKVQTFEGNCWTHRNNINI